MRKNIRGTRLLVKDILGYSTTPEAIVAMHMNLEVMAIGTKNERKFLKFNSGAVCDYVIPYESPEVTVEECLRNSREGGKNVSIIFR